VRSGWLLAGGLGLIAAITGAGLIVANRPAPSPPPERVVVPPAETVPLWPAGLAIAAPEADGPEKSIPGTKPVAGRPWTFVTNVRRPTMTITRPAGRASGAALMVFPGGGYYGLAIDLEGTEVCDWATRIGLTCVLLRYRSPQDWHKGGRHQAPAVQLALQDAQRAMGLLRAGATRWGIDPRRIGVIGFSAGGHLVAAVSNADARSYSFVDAADRLSARPDFAIALYPGHLWSGTGLELQPWNRISAAAPPTFLAHSMDDPVDDVRHSIAYAEALRAVKVPVEMHLYPQGGHAFGLRRTRFPITGWPMRDRGVLPKR
jgi:acetyl esterase/lipase